MVNGGTFNMYSGAISGNRAGSYGGGGVRVYSDATFIMCGGEISGNSASNASAVSVNSGNATFKMTGGYLNGSIYQGTTATTTVSIMGGYFASSPSNIESGYTAISTNDTTWQYIVVESSHGHTVGDDSVIFTNHLDEVTYAGQSSITLSNANYYLATDLTCNITINGTVYLCLNGKVLTGTGNSSVITVSDDATLTLCDCQEGEVENRVTVYSDTNGNTTEKTFNSGVITGGNTSSNGGGVYVYGTFNMYGGTIAGNRAVDDDYGETSNGGGVYVTYQGTFNMNGGEISGNMAGWGGGVHVMGSFIMEDGTISDNTTTGYSHGGGVYVSDGSFIMKGGQISGNIAYNGGGVYVSGSLSAAVTFTMTGGEILGNEATNAGGGVYVSSGRDYTNMFTMVSGTISGNSASNDGGGVYIVGKASFTMNDGTISSNNAYNGGSVFVYDYSDSDTTFTMTGGYLDGSIASSGTISIMGGYLSQSAYETAEDQEAIGEGYTAIKTGNSIWAYVVMSSSSLVHTHSDSIEYTYIDAKEATNNALTLNGGYYYLAADMKLDITIYGTVYLCLNGKVLTGTGSDSVITIGDGTSENAGTLILCDCKEGNTDYAHKYYVDDYLYKFDDGTIDWNTAYENAGTDNQGVIYGGVITGGSTDWGGGVFVRSYSTMYMYSGTIAGNYANNNGGGVLTNGGAVTMSGGIITGNTADSGDGVYLSNTKATFTMTGGFIGGSIYEEYGSISISGGYFSNEPASSFMVTGYMVDLTNKYADFPYEVVVKPHYHGAISFNNLITSDGGEITGGDQNNMAYYYLAGNVTLTKNITIEGYVTICLNGYILTGNGNGSVITINRNANFTLCDCRGGGTITGGSATSGSGVYVGYNSTFTMEGGTISDNAAGGSGGGGVFLNGSTFIMNGGTIKNNTTTSNGGGVVVGGGTFIMTGGTIAGNTAGSNSDAIYVVNSGRFTMTGGYVDGVIIKYNNSDTVSISGGYLSESAYKEEYIAEDYEGVLTGNSTWKYAVLPVSETEDHFHEEIYFYRFTGLTNLEGGRDEGSMVYYYLSENVTLEENITITGYVTLCLNGYMLTGNGNGSVIYVSRGAYFVLCDCNGSGSTHRYYVNENRLFVFDDGTDEWEEDYDDAGDENQGTITGGVITGGTGITYYDYDYTEGGGVFVNSGAEFIMESGTIAGNSAGYGGGVMAFGMFTMNGGTITGNTAIWGGGVEVYDNGDFMNDGTFYMNGGTITENTASYDGGGVFISHATFIMTGGEIFGNKAYYDGGGVLVYRSTFIMTGGTIADNITDSGDGVFVEDSIFNMYGGSLGGRVVNNSSSISVTGGSFTDDAYCSIKNYIPTNGCTYSYEEGEAFSHRISAEIHSHNGEQFTYLVTSAGGTLTGGKDKESMVYYYLAEDITLTTNINIYGYVTLCLNGYMLTGNGYGSVICVSRDAYFVLCDCNGSDSTHYYHISYDKYVFCDYDGTTESCSETEHDIITGGVITGRTVRACYDDYYGGGVFVDSGAESIMEGGTIAGNTANSGGGVYVSWYGKFTMIGGNITGNTANSGGGVIIYNGTFIMEGGAITDNVAGSYGGGVVANGNFTMTGGTIARNKVGTDVNAVYVVNSYTFTMTGGYLDGSITNMGANVTIKGGYLSQEAYELALSSIDTDYMAVNISELGITLDNDYDANYPYAVYTKSAIQYGVSNVYDATYGTTYELTIEDDYDYVIYEWTDGDSNTYGLPTDTSTYTVTAYFFTVTTTGVGEDEEISISVATATFDVTINKGTATINVTENDLNKTYDGNAVGFGANAITVGDLDITNEADVTLVWYSVDNNEETLLESAPVNAGNYKVVITVADTDNYIGSTETIYFTISKAGLSAGAIVGIVIGSVLGALIIAYAVCAILFKKGVVKGKFFEKAYPFMKIEHTQAQQQEKPAQKKKSNSKPDNK